MKFTFELTEQQVNIISQALANGPYAQVAPVIAEMQKQINAHLQAAQQAAAPAPEVAE